MKTRPLTLIALVFCLGVALTATVMGQAAIHEQVEGESLAEAPRPGPGEGDAGARFEAIPVPFVEKEGESGDAVVSQTCAFCDGVSEIPRQECEALVALYTSTDGANWTHDGGWLVTNTPCSWYGVSCGAGHVTHLDLNRNQLSGNIPPELGNLEV